MNTTYNAGNGWFFERRPDGEVRVVVTTMVLSGIVELPGDQITSAIFNADQWESIVRAMRNRKGERHGMVCPE